MSWSAGGLRRHGSLPSAETAFILALAKGLSMGGLGNTKLPSPSLNMRQRHCHAVGLMFWSSRKRFVGSCLFFKMASRSYVGAA